MITGLGSVKDLVSGKQGAFYQTLEEFHNYWDRIDIIAPKISGHSSGVKEFFGNVYVHVSPWPIVFHPIFFLKKGLEIFRNHHFEIMSVQEFPPFYNGIGAALLSKKTRVPYMLEIHHVPGYPRAASLKEVIYRNAVKWCVALDSRKAKAVRVVNKTQTSNFLVQSGVSASKIVFLPSAYIDSSIFNPQESDKKFDLVYAARFEKNKGIASLIEAIEILKKKNRKVSLSIIGSGPLAGSLQGLVDEKGLSEQIYFAGWLKGPREIAEAYRQARIFINPALNEGGPRVALEAMACGLPLITTPIGLMPDLIRHKENGILAGWSAHDLAHAIEEMLDSPELQQVGAQEGPQIASQFDRVNLIRQYAEYLQQL